MGCRAPGPKESWQKRGRADVRGGEPVPEVVLKADLHFSAGHGEDKECVAAQKPRCVNKVVYKGLEAQAVLEALDRPARTGSLDRDRPNR